MSRTIHLVDPSLVAALQIIPSVSVSNETLADTRSEVAQMTVPIGDYAREDVQIETHVAPGSPDVRVLIYRPKNCSGLLPAFLQMHGGGYVLGSAELSGPRNIGVAADTGCIVASVDYRLSPETRAPGSVEDCYTALRWLKEEAGSLGIDPTRIAIGGESAGGGLAAALALMARDRGEVSICFQMLIYPMIDDRTGTEPVRNQHVGEFIWNAESNSFCWSSLLGHDPGRDDVSPYCAAARASDLTGLPPAYIAVGALDLFLDENIDYAQRLLAAGVPTELHIYPGAYHGFEFAPDSPLVLEALRERQQRLARAFAAAPAESR